MEQWGSVVSKILRLCYKVKNLRILIDRIREVVVELGTIRFLYSPRGHAAAVRERFFYPFLNEYFILSL